MTQDQRARDAAAAGRADIGALYRRYAGWLRAILSRRFGPDKADDLVQETYLRLQRYEGQVVAHPTALLGRVAHNLAVSDHRRERARGGLALNLEEVEDAPEIAIPPEQAELVLLKQIILSMPQTYCDVFVLNRFTGLSYLQIAKRLGLSVKTVEWRMSRALAHCAAELTRDG